MRKEISKEMLNKLFFKIKGKSKYQAVSIPDETIVDLLNDSASKYHSLHEIEHNVEEKLHNIVATYLGDIDYNTFYSKFDCVLEQDDSLAFTSFINALLSAHQSTKERLPYIQNFYNTIFNEIGTPQSIADVACGLHPFGIPYMNLKHNTKYYAYDLNMPRINAIDYYISKLGYSGGGIHKDIFVSPPQEQFDAVFFFKEAHRFEKRKKGCLKSFLSSFNAKIIVLSLPIMDLCSKYDLSSKHDSLVSSATDGLKITVKDVGNERLYFLRNVEY